MNPGTLSRTHLLAVAHLGNRLEIVSTLQAIDPNGTWGDSESKAEGMEPLSRDEASASLLSLISELPE